jgi:hypothetical protein
MHRHDQGGRADAFEEFRFLERTGTGRLPDYISLSINLSTLFETGLRVRK